MDVIGTLANQHFLEWESRLKHIDEMMDKLHEAHAKGPERSDTQLQLSKIKKARDDLALGAARVRRLPAGQLFNATSPVHGLKTSFETVGLELEKVLATVVGVN